MQSDERILTTHCGSLPRPPALSELLLQQEAGEPIDQRRLHQESSEAVVGVLRAQVDAGIDIRQRRRAATRWFLDVRPDAHGWVRRGIQTAYSKGH